ncbi:MAG: tetratricopeptide repeat protein [Phycisphaerales bacterium]|nr:tetratricopeptide repeat protein [Phycisphaerales bacterium]
MAPRTNPQSDARRPGPVALALGAALMPAVAGALAVMAFATDEGPRLPSAGASAPHDVGSFECARCHEAEHKAWLGSHHQLAMLPASEVSVLGDFDDAVFENYGVTSRFFRRDGRFIAETEGPDGAIQEYPIAYTFGWTPLQQYLVEFPDGRYQVLPLCWDTRPKEAGGQRWFHIHPEERIAPDDVLYWTGIAGNWNYMCAECHSTNLRKGLDPATGAYHTTFDEVNVGCEACHGPGSNHVAWADAKAAGQAGADGAQPAEGSGLPDMGLAVVLKDPPTRNADGSEQPAFWDFVVGQPTKQRTAPLASPVQIETCARCHARRRLVSEDHVHGRPLLDTHEPATLDRGLYHPDGQILDEVYVYGSFVQSKMHHAGVRCTDCHDPHTTRLLATGNFLCANCHVPDHFDTPAHHFHSDGSTGAECVNCHMPTATYMVVDPRRDHSFRVPRPDLSLSLGVPNACTQCHADQNDAWADEWCAKWYGAQYRSRPQFGTAIQAGRTGAPGAAAQLRALAEDQGQPAIVRATAMSMLAERPTAAAVETARAFLREAEPLLRSKAVTLLELLPPEARVEALAPALDDPVRTVRTQAAKALADVPPELLSTEQQDRLRDGVQEYIQSELANADRAAAHLNLGLLFSRLGDDRRAEAAYRRAMALEPWLAEPVVNLADLYRATGREPDAERLLRDALARNPETAVLHEALGLSLVRLGRTEEALASLAEAARLDPDNPRHAYVYGIGLFSVGRSDEAMAVLTEANRRHPNDQALLQALMQYSLQLGRVDDALRHARALLVLEPDNPQIAGLVRGLEEAQR